MDSTAVFVGMIGGLRNVADAIAPVLQTQWHEVNDSSSHRMEADTPHYWVSLFKHEYSDDRDMQFTKFPFELGVYTHNDAVRVAAAREMFERLKALNVPLMLVDAVQTKLDEWHPTQ